MWGIIPAAGRGTRIQPLAFSKELLPIGSKRSGHTEKPCAVSEHLVDRMLAAGVDKLCFVIAPGKSDILEYYGDRYGGADICYVVQPAATGLCDALFRALPFVAAGDVACVGLPDTIWFPAGALASLPDDALSLLLFPVEHPELFDAVVLDERDQVLEVRVQQRDPGTDWIWGAFRLPGHVFHELHALWSARECRDEYIGTLVNAYLAAGGKGGSA